MKAVQLFVVVSMVLMAVDARTDKTRCAPLKGDEIYAIKQCVAAGTFDKYKARLISELKITPDATEISRLNALPAPHPSANKECGTLFLGSVTDQGNHVIRAAGKGYIVHEPTQCLLFGGSLSSYVIPFIGEFASSSQTVLLDLNGAVGGRITKPAPAKQKYTMWDELDNIIEGCVKWMGDADMISYTCMEIAYSICNHNIVHVNVQIGTDLRGFQGIPCKKIMTVFKPFINKVLKEEKTESLSKYLNWDGVSPSFKEKRFKALNP